MSDLIHSGSLQYIDYIHVDWPTHKNVDSSNGSKIEDLAHQNFKYAFTFATQVNLYKFFFRKAIEVIQNLIYSENLNLERFTEITDLDDERHAFDIDFSCSRMQPWRRIRNAKNFNFINVCYKYGKTAQVKHLCNETIHFFLACRKPVGKHIFTANILTISITIELFYHPILVKRFYLFDVPADISMVRP